MLDEHGDRVLNPLPDDLRLCFYCLGQQVRTIMTYGDVLTSQANVGQCNLVKPSFFSTDIVAKAKYDCTYWW